MRRLLTILLLAALHHSCSAQTVEPKHVWEKYIEQLIDYDDIEERDAEDLFDRLYELENDPIDLNNATDDDLQRLVFLSAKQREDLTEYLDRYRPLQSLAEIALVESIDPLRKELLRAFCVVGKPQDKHRIPSPKQIAKNGKNELTATAQVPFYDRQGDRNGYLGYKLKHWIRYTFSYGNRLKAGLTGAQDAGEPFFANCNKQGYDHYSYYLLLRQIGAFRTIALGLYKLRLGLGLVANTGFALGKTATASMSLPSNAITANSSRSEARYLQGAATTVTVAKHTDATAFVSYRTVDATLNDDGTIRTLLQTGYHRTESEIRRRHNATQFVSGVNVNWQAKGIRLGANAVYTSYNLPLHPDPTKAYLRFSPMGSHFFNASLYYSYTHHRFAFCGETATNRSGAIATLNTLCVQATTNLALTAIQRYYSYRYSSLLASSFSDAGRIQNENGIYVSAAWSPLATLSLTAYTDYAYHPWARYRVSAASHSWDNLLQIAYRPNRRLSLSARYRLRLRQQDYKPSTEASAQLADRTEHRARIALGFDGNTWSTKTQIDATQTTTAPPSSTATSSTGWMLSQSVAMRKGCFTLAANAAYFHTTDYDSRLYCYERTTLFSFSFPMFYGNGIRAALFLRADITPKLTLIGKTGTTKYFDRDHISSSYQRIDQSHKTDLDVQLRWRF